MAGDGEGGGYGRPPTKHQFKKGQSGNPRGRKPKRERSLSERQFRRDFFAAAETEVVFNTEGGAKKLTLLQAMLQNIMVKAAKGDRFAQKLALDVYRDLLPEHEADNRVLQQSLESVEKHLLEHGDEGFDAAAHRALNELRRKTRKI